MNDHNDRLMHGHGRTTDAPPSIQATIPKQAPMSVVSSLEDDHDDGLVHDHNWACTERGAPAHR